MLIKPVKFLSKVWFAFAAVADAVSDMGAFKTACATQALAHSKVLVRYAYFNALSAEIMAAFLDFIKAAVWNPLLVIKPEPDMLFRYAAPFCNPADAKRIITAACRPKQQNHIFFQMLAGGIFWRLAHLSAPFKRSQKSS